MGEAGFPFSDERGTRLQDAVLYSTHDHPPERLARRLVHLCSEIDSKTFGSLALKHGATWATGLPGVKPCEPCAEPASVIMMAEPVGPATGVLGDVAISRLSQLPEHDH